MIQEHFYTTQATTAELQYEGRSTKYGLDILDFDVCANNLQSCPTKHNTTLMQLVWKHEQPTFGVVWIEHHILDLQKMQRNQRKKHSSRNESIELDRQAIQDSI